MYKKIEFVKFEFFVFKDLTLIRSQNPVYLSFQHQPQPPFNHGHRRRCRAGCAGRKAEENR